MRPICLLKPFRGWYNIITTMKQVLLIGGKTSDQDETKIMAGYADYFVEGIHNTHANFVHFDQLSLIVEPEAYTIFDTRNQRALEDYDLIIFRGKIRANSELAYCVSRFCSVKNIPFLNDYTPYRAASKVSQAITFFELNVNFMKTLYSMNNNILRDLTKKELQLPFILKDSYGAHGNSNYLIKSYAQFDEILEKQKDVKFIAQAFFPNECDYRIVCIGNKELVIRRSAVGDSHLNNTSQGGSAEIVDSSFFPSSSIESAHMISSKLSMGIAGVDLLYNEDTKDYAFLEVNSQPQLNSGAFPEEKQLLVKDYISSMLT